MILSKTGSQDISMICLSCGHHRPMKFRFTITGNDATEEEVKYGIESFDIRHDAISGLCPICGCSDIIFVDRKLEDIVAKLNSMSCFTAYCCEGHLTKEYEQHKWGQIISHDAVYDPYLTFCPYYEDRAKREGLGMEYSEMVCKIGEELNKTSKRTKMSIVADIPDKVTAVRYVSNLWESLCNEYDKDNLNVSILIQATLNTEASSIKKDFKEIQEDFIQYLNTLVSMLDDTIKKYYEERRRERLGETQASTTDNKTGTD